MRRRRHGVPSGVAVLLAVLLPAIMLAGCGTIPDNSSPQPIRSFERDNPPNAVPTPQSDMDPEALVRSFLKATANPASGHQAARKFLTQRAAGQWDDSGDMVVVDDVNVFIDERDSDSARLRLIGDNVGTLRSDGQLVPATGRVETTLTLVRDGDQWRIDGALPSGTMIDSNQFDSLYRAATLYFPDRTGTRLVPDPRWFYQGQDADPTVLVDHLIEGPSKDLDAAVNTALPDGTALRGPVTTLPGGGVQIDLTGAGSAGERDRTQIAAQIIWTLDGVEIGGPYIINNDGGPLVPARSSGWQTADVKAFDPTTAPTTDVGLNIIRDGALLKVTDSGAVPVTGPLGISRQIRSAAIATNGSRVAAVVARGGADTTSDLTIGGYGEGTATITSSDSITRPSFGADENTVWAVVDGNPVQWMRDADGSSERLTPVDAAQVQNVVRGPITDLQVASDGVRAAMVVAGQVVFAVVSSNDEGRVTLTSPRIAAYNIGNRAVSLSWASPTTLMVARDAPESPVVQVSINGTPAVGLLSGNLSPPVRSVAADRSTVYVGDTRGVLRLGNTNGQPDQYWTEVESAMTPGTIPVVP